MEVAILNFGCRTTVKISTTIEKTIEKCAEFYKGIHLFHNQCMILAGASNQYFPEREEHMKNLQERLENREEVYPISKVLMKKTLGFGFSKIQHTRSY